MRFTVNEARSGNYLKAKGEPLPDEVEFTTLGQLMNWIERCGTDVVIGHSTNSGVLKQNQITVYNDYLE